MEEAGTLEALSDFTQRWAVDKDFFMPGHSLVEPTGKLLSCDSPLLESFLSTLVAAAGIIFLETPHREQEENVPFVSLAVTHPERRMIPRRCIEGHMILVKLNEVEKPPRSRLYGHRFIEFRPHTGAGKKENHGKECTTSHQRSLLLDLEDLGTLLD